MSELLFWHWWILGLVLLAAEAFLPGASFLWLGLASLVTGVVVWVFPALTMLLQVIVFAVLALGSVLIWRRLRGTRAEPVNGAPLNDRASSYLGRIFTLEMPIVDGTGSIRIDDGRWRISGPNLAGGARIRIVGVDGATLKVVEADTE